MFSMCSELAPRAHIPDTRIPQLMQPWSHTFVKRLNLENTQKTTKIVRTSMMMESVTENELVKVQE